MKIYLDTCCYGRPYDDPAQTRIAIEAAAVKGIIDICRIAGHCIVGSMAVASEIGENSNLDKMKEIRTYFDDTINEYLAPVNNVRPRARALQAEGVKRVDSYHLAFAEAAGADALLTTDDKFIKICARKKLSFVKVINPVNFLPEVLN
jgi:predicted nucleic acid-binding protein